MPITCLHLGVGQKLMLGSGAHIYASMGCETKNTYIYIFTPYQQPDDWVLIFHRSSIRISLVLTTLSQVKTS